VKLDKFFVCVGDFHQRLMDATEFHSVVGRLGLKVRNMESMQS